ncbi:MAG: SUMF1/EgtB/PvdO family nonheme iron enzyme [Gammaproteobacteria bacterium]|nr:SUMF1/EgtB/PvdO family nonheme iron enzyme [Gammaproteobacteria bacterium]NNJ49903.1 ergothioneine biosynthesis protein EgtB [Gammaproteobacteria bacterium]
MSETTITEQTINSLIDDLKDARKRTLELVEDLDEQQIIGPKLDIVNPLLWEIGHTAYFHELWTLRHQDGADPLLENADELYDSISIAHDDRWNLPLLSLDDTRDYMQQVLDAEIDRLKNKKVTAADIYLTRYAIFHEDMHTEAYTYSRRTLDYPAPIFENSVLHDEAYDTGALDGDVVIEGGRFLLGAREDTEFCFDNEKWQHPLEIKTFSMARAATSFQQFAAFVDAGGYQNRKYWDRDGWNWLQQNNLQAPNGWKKDEEGNWLIKEFDLWQPVRPHAAVIHISWYEASAWCRWAQRRLPSEAEWELAASGVPGNINQKRKYPWGEEQPSERHVNMNSRAMRSIDVSALPEGDSAYGCRQMLGNVWEWTADTFKPYPGFVADMYQDYSQPLFGQTKVLRGGAWPTRSRMIRNTWRNYYGAERNDVFAGFRSCAL